jgi:hypothetical protein
VAPDRKGLPADERHSVELQASSFDWEDEPLGAHTVVAIDAIDHGDRTHVTLRHVGLPDRAQRDLHEALWRHWFGRLRRAAGDAPVTAAR